MSDQDHEAWIHPVHYTIFKPNDLIHADESALQGAELRMYEEILNDNHRKYPDKLTYSISYDLIFTSDDNVTANRKRLSNSMQSKKIYLPREFNKKWFNVDAERGIVLIPTLTYDIKARCFIVELNKHFKKILTLMDGQLSFTKGDIKTLRSFKHDITHRWYWLAREKQQFRKVWEIDIDALREEMKITGYKDYRNFKRRVLNLIEEDTKGTFMEFTLGEKRRGRGNAVKGLKFIFKHGPKDITDTPVGYEYRWERLLKAMEIGDLAIKDIRHKVKAQSLTTLEDGRQIVWDSDYIRYSIEAAKNEFHAKEKDKKREKVKNKAGWLLNGLHDGQWLEEVEQARKQDVNQVQGKIEFDATVSQAVQELTDQPPRT